MTRNLLITALAVLIVASVAVANPGQRGAMAHRGQCVQDGEGPHRGVMKIGMLLNVADEIGLDQKQQDQLLELHQQFGLQRIEMKADLEKAQLNLRHLRMSESSETTILAAMDEVGELRTEMQKMRYQHREKVKDILTEEQIDKLTTLKKERRSHDGQGLRGDGQRQGNSPDAPRGGGRRGW